MSAAAVLIAAAPLIIRLLAAPGYFTAWHYVPLLVLGAAVASLGSFFSSVYTSEMRTSATFMSTLIGAAANLVGNALLIPRWGAMGAAAAVCCAAVLLLYCRPMARGLKSGVLEVVRTKRRG